MTRKTILLWDLPTRLFHWLLVAAVVAAVLTGEFGGGLIEWHARIGLVIAGLVAFRLVWGLVGPTYARFAQFFPTPARLRLYLAGAWRGIGHNPLGGLSVLTLLGLLGAQLATGLVANDDLDFVGPLFALAGRDLSDRLSGLHHLLADGLLVIAGLHVAAIFFHGRFKQDDLLRPMLTGRKEVDAGESARGGGRVALLLALAIAGLAVYGASGAWLPG